MSLLRYLPRFRRAYQALPVLAAREGWSRAEIEAYQLDRLNSIWKKAVVHVPHYRWLARQFHLPDRFVSLEEYQAVMPILPKASVRANPGHFLSTLYCSGSWRCTSGSSGEKTHIFWPVSAQEETLQAKYRFLDQWGLDVFERTAFLWGRGNAAASGLRNRLEILLQPIQDWLRNRIRLSPLRVGREDLQRYLTRIRAFGPSSLYSYSMAAYLLALEAQEADFECPNLKLIMVTAEPAPQSIVEVIQGAFHVPVAIEYGSSEIGFMAGVGPDKTLRVREDVVLIETVQREDGRYEIVVSNLINSAFPLLRYALGDVCDRPLNRPERGFAILPDVAGRANDLIISRTGRLLRINLFDELMSLARKVRRWSLQQHADGGLTVWVELSSPEDFDQARLEQGLTELVDGFPVNLQVVDQLAASASGKHRWVRSELADTFLRNWAQPRSQPLEMTR